MTLGHGGATLVTLILFLLIVNVVAIFACKFIGYGVNMARKSSYGEESPIMEQRGIGSPLMKFMAIMGLLILLAVTVNLM